MISRRKFLWVLPFYGLIFVVTALFILKSGEEENRAQSAELSRKMSTNGGIICSGNVTGLIGIDGMGLGFMHYFFRFLTYFIHLSRYYLVLHM